MWCVGGGVYWCVLRRRWRVCRVSSQFLEPSSSLYSPDYHIWIKCTSWNPVLSWHFNEVAQWCWARSYCSYLIHEHNRHLIHTRAYTRTWMKDYFIVSVVRDVLYNNKILMSVTDSARASVCSLPAVLFVVILWFCMWFCMWFCLY